MYFFVVFTNVQSLMALPELNYVLFEFANEYRLEIKLTLGWLTPQASLISH